jgi:hypothetical protein
LRNRVLRRVFGLKKDETIEACRNLDNEELRNLYSSQIYNQNDEFKVDEMGRACGTHGREDKFV